MWQTICVMLMTIVTAGAELTISPAKSQVLVAKDKPLSINCTGPLKSTPVWTKDNSNSLPDGVQIHQKVDNGDNVSILSISSVSLQHGGTYRCKDSQDQSTTEQAIRVKVVSVDTEGALFQYQQGSALTCSVAGENLGGTITYKWKRNETYVEKLETPKGEKFKVHDNGTLELLPTTTTREDAGVYTCEVTVKTADTEDTLTAQVSLYAEPMVIPFEKSKNLVQEERLDIRCRVLGYPTPNITWYKDDVELTGDDSRYKFAEEGGVSNGQLNIDSVDFDDAGDYKCIASARDDNFSNKTITFNASEVIVVRVKDKLAALWPFLGIVAEVVILCTIIFIYEKKRNKDAGPEEDINQDGATPEKTKEGVRHRGNTNNPRA